MWKETPLLPTNCLVSKSSMLTIWKSWTTQLLCLLCKEADFFHKNHPKPLKAQINSLDSLDAKHKAAVCKRFKCVGVFSVLGQSVDCVQVQKIDQWKVVLFP